MRIDVRSCSGTRLALIVVGVLVSALLPASASAATRTWVSGVGDDANPCSRTAPCKTLASAISKTDAGGEIDLLDPAGVGSVTITKAITIDANGFQAGVLAAGTNGIVISAAATDDVILRGLNIEGLGSGLNGVLVLSAHNVQITDTKIHGFVTAGVSVAGSAVDTNLLLNHVSISGTAIGLNVSPVAPHTSSFFVSASSLTGDATAVRVDTGGTAWLQGTTIFGNTTGLSLLGTGVANAYADTSIVGNATNGVPTTMLGVPAPGLAGPAGPAGASPPVVTTRLVIVASAARSTTRLGRAVRLGFAATANAIVTTTVRRGTTVVAKLGSAAHLGLNQVTWKPGKAPVGTYRVTIVATDANGKASMTTLSVVVTR